MNIPPGTEITHALVYFADEGSSAVVPSSRLIMSGDTISLKEGQNVEVCKLEYGKEI